MVLVVTIAVTALVLGASQWRPARFTARASFVEQRGEGGAGRLASLAAQLGVGGLVQTSGRSPQFYADLLETDRVLRATVDYAYVFRGPGAFDAQQHAGSDMTLIDLSEVDGDTHEERVEEAVDRLRRALRTSVDRETGIVRVTFHSHWPEISTQVVNRLVALVHEFNLEARQAQASAERSFVEERLELAEQEVVAAEERLRAFLERNRDFSGSPELQLVHDRLEREVSLRHGVLTALAQAYEQARIEEVRNTPVITVLQPPLLPAFPDERRPLLMSLVGVVAGLIVGVTMIALAEIVRADRELHQEEYETFLTLRGEVRRELKTLVGRAEKPGQSD